ncbi:LppX_LprAFG lipoprotein [Streptomyces sp. NRRL S-340]|uniref:LppX_LprAFG lipoprotein n=1 Tax=Streptomyces sp. NRRL S-340 TaxID=1463901 RepID=UPI000AE3AE72|nr:LppX_LprAFG lipoprotein [Streptomyces sp. NRRL S-340]
MDTSVRTPTASATPGSARTRRTPARAVTGRRVATASLAALVLAAGAVGCSGDDSKSDSKSAGKSGAAESPRLSPAAAVAKAAENSQEITSLHYRMTGQIPEEGHVKAEAQMQMKPTVSMSMKMTMAEQPSAGTVEIRLVDKAMYLNGGAEAAKEMGGKSWLKFDLSQTDAGKQMDQMGAAQADQNPATESTFLTAAKDLRKVGSESVDGVATTHYSGTVALADLVKAQKGESPQTAETRQKSLEQYKKMGLDKVTMDAWIDGQNHTKQFRMRGDAAKGPLDMTITFLDTNKPVKVSAPPAGQVADLAEMMKGAQQD